MKILLVCRPLVTLPATIDAGHVGLERIGVELRREIHGLERDTRARQQRGIGVIAGQREHRVGRQRLVPAPVLDLHGIGGDAAARVASRRTAIDPSFTRFSRSGRTQYLSDEEKSACRWTMVTCTPERYSSSAASAAEFAPPIDDDPLAIPGVGLGVIV